MYRTAVLVFFCALLSVPSYSQISITTGIKGGITESGFGGDNSADLKRIRGTAAGIFFEIDVPGPINFQPEVLYTTRGARSEGAETITTTLTYIDIPLLVRFVLPIPVISPTLYAGPSAGMLLGAKEKTESPVAGTSEINVKGRFTGTDYGIVVGASASLPLMITDLSVEARYYHGLKALALDGSIKQYSRMAAILVGITL
jgi:hypothetical protein